MTEVFGPATPREREKAFRIVGAQQAVVEDDRIHRTRAGEQNRNLRAVDNRAAGRPAEARMDAAVLLDD